ncbi:hypothetical protein GZ77_05280 [Endozoicomonas montiporae]|uniref:DZANK-type domain-containing protein n=2 Tax=Endozoicomonas montiporae TaxID=1027273 RepID=A0A081NBU5_9GAMM|nr:hypothetical protein [Endozoicomonas montiporae]AMO56225.1 hypothetical protein EZMO1_2108 [Endozoicomonas montiporae CL-33]KEQ15918.1 hypothetical protein GZ77_05280 [Endozoicomonas montiporae]
MDKHESLYQLIRRMDRILWAIPVLISALTLLLCFMLWEMVLAYFETPGQYLRGTIAGLLTFALQYHMLKHAWKPNKSLAAITQPGEDEKVCPFCGECIDLHARFCCHCRQRIPHWDKQGKPFQHKTRWSLQRCDQCGALSRRNYGNEERILCKRCH